MIKKFKQNLNRLQKWERLPKIQWFVNIACVEHNMDNITKNKFYIYIAFVNREQQEKHTKENKQTTASIIQQQQKKKGNQQTWVTKYILLTLLYSAKPKHKCEYQAKAKQT